MVVQYEQDARTSEIADKSSLEEWLRVISTYQPGLTVMPSVLSLEWLDNDAHLLSLLTQGLRHTPGSDHIDPALSIHNQDYKNGEKEAFYLATPLMDALKRGRDLGYKSLEGLIEAVEAAALHYTSEPIRVGMVGDIGQGKSSLIGALLDDKEIIKHVSSLERS